ncbi:MAG: nucleotidyl transferase AbiEii/AbiGii toxin family protein [Coprothermobacterota bacterium]|nr:nucleotidyl transferase AbiEii/AbiGii toxin family protein [Coprothermobacterota bacterium]
MASLSQIPDLIQFYLTGGTALAEFYLGHRKSFDLDIFTGEESADQPVNPES